MIIKQELVKKIKDYFGLNVYETKVWLALLSKGIVSAGETAELSGVPRSRTYDVLESLEKRGFAIVKIGKPVRYIAVEPSVIIEKMKMQIMGDAHDKVKALSELKDRQEYMELEQIHKSGMAPIKSEDISGFMRGKSNILIRLKEMFSKAEKEIGIYTTSSEFESKLKLFSQIIDNAKKRNVKTRIFLSGDVESIKKLNLKHGIKAKHSKHKGRFFTSDKNEIIFIINPENSQEENAIWLKSPFLTESLDYLCEMSGLNNQIS